MRRPSGQFWFESVMIFLLIVTVVALCRKEVPWDPWHLICIVPALLLAWIIERLKPWWHKKMLELGLPW